MDPTILTIVVLIVVLIVVNVLERRDMKCSDATNSAWSECTDNYQAWVHSKPSPEDSTSVLLDKIDNAAGSEHNTVKWRRSMTAAIVSTLFGQMLMTACYGFKGLYWKNILIQVVVTFLVVYMVYDYYSFHVYDIPLRENIPNGLKLLRSRLPAGTSSAGRPQVQRQTLSSEGAVESEVVSG